VEKILNLMPSNKNTILTSKNRCSQCGKILFIEEGKEFCFHCKEIAPKEKQWSEEMGHMVENRTVNELTNRFKERSLMNRDLETATLNEYKAMNDSQKEAKEKAVDYIINFNGTDGLILIGSPGIGKSHIAASIAKAMIKKKKTSIFISMPRLLTELKNTYNRQSELTESNILTALQKVDLLVIDDLGAERAHSDDKGTAWAKGKIFEIIDARIGLSTVYTTNYTAEQLIGMYGERDFSRMIQYCDQVKMDGDNFRLKRFNK
jgi:DNA replication protein DnaC